MKPHVYINVSQCLVILTILLIMNWYFQLVAHSIGLERPSISDKVKMGAEKIANVVKKPFAH